MRFRKKKDRPLNFSAISGISSETGFSITITDNKSGRSLCFITKKHDTYDYTKEFIPQNTKQKILSVSDTIGILAGIAVFHSAWLQWGVLAALAIVVGVFFTVSSLLVHVCMFYLELKERFIGKNLPKWHAAEHMLITLISSGKPLTREYFLKQPRVHPNCGSQIFGTKIGILLFFLGFCLVWIYPVAAILPLVLSLFATSFLHRIVQHFWVTQAPQEPQITETMALLKIIKIAWNSKPKNREDDTDLDF